MHIFIDVSYKDYETMNASKKQKIVKILLSKSGFTLIEMIITIGVFAILILLIFNFFSIFNKRYIAEDSKILLLNDVRAIAEIISYDIKMAGFDPLLTANAGFEEASHYKIRITSDKNLSGTIDNKYLERITYFFDPQKNTLKQILYETTTSQSTQTLLTDITDFNFKFYKNNNIPTANIKDIRSVLITFTLPTADNNLTTLTIRSDVRN